MKDRKIESLLLRIRDAAPLVGMTSTAFRRLVERGGLPAVRIGRRIFVRRADLEALIEGAAVMGPWARGPEGGRA